MTAAAFQTTVRRVQGFGVAGQLFSDQPLRAEPFQLDVAAAVCTMQTVVSQGICTLGGSGVLAGIIFNPNVYALKGDGTNPLNPSLTLAAKTMAELLKEGEIIIPLAADAAIGDPVRFLVSNGVLSTYKAEAQFTASQTTTVLTVSAVAQGILGVGTVVKNASGEILGTIISLGTGTGGTGTYNLDTSATVGSAAMTGNSVLPSTYRDAYGHITRFTPDAGAAQLAVASFNLPV